MCVCVCVCMCVYSLKYIHAYNLLTYLYPHMHTNQFKYLSKCVLIYEYIQILLTCICNTSMHTHTY